MRVAITIGILLMLALPRTALARPGEAFSGPSRRPHVPSPRSQATDPLPQRGEGKTANQSPALLNPLPSEERAGEERAGEERAGEEEGRRLAAGVRRQADKVSAVSPDWGGDAPPPVTSYPRMVAELHDDAQRTPWIRLAVIGKSHQERGLWMARIADPAGPPAAHTTRILVLCRQHGDEPASTEALLDLLRHVADGKSYPPRQVTLYVVPMVNPDGATAGTRLNGVGADLNRDWGIFSQPETRAVAHAAALIHPQIVVDAHNWDTTDSYNANCLEVSRDSATAQGRAVQALEAGEVAALQQYGYAVASTSYDQYAEPHLAHRWFTQQGVLACLVETHSGSPNNTADFKRRQAIYVALVTDLARRYAGSWRALDALEHLHPASVRETVLFPEPLITPNAITVSEEASRVRPLGWLWAILSYAFALFAAFSIRIRDSEWARRSASVPISRKRSEKRHGRRPYPRARYSLAPRPSPQGHSVLGTHLPATLVPLHWQTRRALRGVLPKREEQE